LRIADYRFPIAECKLVIEVCNWLEHTELMPIDREM
jgi:hypothetical protein